MLGRQQFAQLHKRLRSLLAGGIGVNGPREVFTCLQQVALLHQCEPDSRSGIRLTHRLPQCRHCRRDFSDVNESYAEVRLSPRMGRIDLLCSAVNLNGFLGFPLQVLRVTQIAEHLHIGWRKLVRPAQIADGSLLVPGFLTQHAEPMVQIHLVRMSLQQFFVAFTSTQQFPALLRHTCCQQLFAVPITSHLRQPVRQTLTDSTAGENHRQQGLQNPAMRPTKHI